jgi:peptidoglycan hydrolase-like protein with peptidoglycan-binding domain
VALTSLGFDTRGSDGAFGPRTRETIAAWQKAHSRPSTGFLDGTQHQALLREAAPALQKYDEEQKKKEDEEKKKAEEDAKAKAAAAAATPPPSPPPATTAPGGSTAFDGRWTGASTLANGATQPLSVNVRNGEASGGWRNQRCGGDVTFTVSIRPDGAFTVVLTGYNQGCQRGTNTFTGAVQGSTLAFTFGAGNSFSLTR